MKGNNGNSKPGLNLNASLIAIRGTNSCLRRLKVFKEGKEKELGITLSLGQTIDLLLNAAKQP